jgi:hypothetical protein
MITFRKTILSAALATTSVSAIACGDGSGPDSVDANGALQSLALALQGAIAFGPLTNPEVGNSFAGVGPLLTQTTITVDGQSHQVYALGVRESFPEGTCEEDLFVDPEFPNDPGICTPPSLTTALFFWQSHSANERPDRLLLVVTDPGTVSFDDGAFALPSAAFAFYSEAGNDPWASLSGTITSAVTSLNQQCNVQLPAYAKTGTCSIGAFNEQGQIVLEPFLLDQPPIPTQMTVVIPPQTLHGLLLDITEVQPVTLPPPVAIVEQRVVSPRLARLAPQIIRAR